MTNFISDRIQEWLEQTPTASNVVIVLTWMANHPLLSLIIFLLSLVVIGKIVKGLDRLLEVTGLSVLKVVFNFIWRGVRGVLITVGRLTGWGWEKILVKPNEVSEELAIASVEIDPTPVKVDKYQRLQEIQTRLEAINQEQNELLQEATGLLVEDNSIVTPNTLNV